MQMKASDEVRRLVFAGALACVPLVAPCGPLQGDSGATVVPVRHWSTGPLYPFRAKTIEGMAKWKSRSLLNWLM